jgi:hypothetical protein
MTDMLGEPPGYILKSWKARTSSQIRVNKSPTRTLGMQLRELREGNATLSFKDRQSEFSDEDIALLTALLSSMLRVNSQGLPKTHLASPISKVKEMVEGWYGNRRHSSSQEQSLGWRRPGSPSAHLQRAEFRCLDKLQ